MNNYQKIKVLKSDNPNLAVGSVLSVVSFEENYTVIVTDGNNDWELPRVWVEIL